MVPQMCIMLSAVALGVEGDILNISFRLGVCFVCCLWLKWQIRARRAIRFYVADVPLPLRPGEIAVSSAAGMHLPGLKADIPQHNDLVFTARGQGLAIWAPGYAQYRVSVAPEGCC